MRRVAVAAILGVTSTFLQADEVNFQTLLESARSPLSIEQGILKGDGAKLVLENANQAQFVSLGEGHFNQETPAFTQALLNSVSKDRFRYFGIEIGPYSAEFLQQVVNQENPLQKARGFFEQYPQAIAFADHIDEFNLLLNFKTHGVEPDRIWGLDQEFILSARFLLDELSSYVSTDSARNYVAGLKKRAQKGYDTFKSEGVDSLLLNTLTQSEVDELRFRLKGEERPEVAFIVNELEASRNIYRAYQEERYYDNNQGRIDLFKSNFMRHFNIVREKTGEAPRVLVKMGSYHAGRGLSPVNHFDMGNFLSELAYSLGQKSYHIMVIAPKQISGGDIQDLVEQQPMIEPFVKLQEGGQPVVFDLAMVRNAMRGSILKKLSRGQVNMVYAYDAVVVFPEFTSALPINPR